MLLVDDMRIIAVVECFGPEHGSHCSLECFQQLLFDFVVHQDIVWCYAGLSGIETFAPDDSPCRKVYIAVSIHDDRALAAQFQGDGSQALCCLLHHNTSHSRASGEENVVKAVKEQLFVHLAAALEGGDMVTGKRF